MAADQSAQHSLKGFFALVKGSRLEYLGILLVLSLVAAGEGVAQPLLIKSIFDEGVFRSNFSRFLLFAGAYVAFGLVVNIISYGTGIWGRSFENRIVKITSRRMLEAYYSKEYQSVLLNGHGYFINRIYGDVQDGLVPIIRLIQVATNQTVLLIASSAVLLYLSWKAFLILAALIPFSAAASGLLGKKIKALTSLEREQQGAVLSVLTKALGAFRIVNGFQLVSPTVDVFDSRLGDYLRTSYRRYKIARGFQALNDSTMVISDFFSMFVGALFVLRGALTFGGYLAFVNTFWRAVTTLMQLLNQMPDFQRLGVITNRIASFLATSRFVYHVKGEAPSVKAIRFSYNDATVFKGMSLQLSAGEKVVIVGPNGSGKTTLANILSGYLSPSHGDVILPERISSITLPISFPPVRVRYLVNDIDLLSAFSLQDEPVLGAFADELSSGQQQKLALALALSRDADLYVIDEPLANLDRQSRDVAMHLLVERTRGKSLVAIMHGCEEYHYLFDRVINIADLSSVPSLQNAVELA